MTTTDADASTDTTDDPYVVGETEDDTRKITIGRILAYIVGAISILAGLAVLTSSPAMGVFMAAAGLFALPPIRQVIRDQMNIEFSRWFVALVYLVLVGVGAALAGPAPQ